MSVLATYTSKFLEKKKKQLEEKKEIIKDNENEKDKSWLISATPHTRDFSHELGVCWFFIVKIIEILLIL